MKIADRAAAPRRMNVLALQCRSASSIHLAILVLVLIPMSAQVPPPRVQVEYDFECLSKSGAVSSWGVGAADFCTAFNYEFRKDDQSAVYYFRRAAEAGFAPAQLALGEHYNDGTGGLQKDTVQAFAWYTKAAQQGYADAQSAIGRAHLRGLGVPENRAEGLRWLQLAAKNGSYRAMNSLSAIEMSSKPRQEEPAQDLLEESNRLYRAGRKTEAVNMYSKAAQAGNSMAQYQMGNFYREGKDIQQNPTEAAKWYRSAAAKGNAWAQNTLGLVYEEGTGAPENWVEAARLYRLSAEQNNHAAQAKLSRAYQFGIGVPQNRSTAIHWMKRAAALGNGESLREARRLSVATNFVGFRTAGEKTFVLGSRLLPTQAAFYGGDPEGILFRNSTERYAWLQRFRNALDLEDCLSSRRCYITIK